MRTPLTAVLLCCANVLVACVAGALLWTIANPLFATAIPPLGTVLLAALLVGLAAWAGIEVGALLARRGPLVGRVGWHLTGGATYGAGVLFGIAFGLSLTARAQQRTSTSLFVAAMAAVALLSGMAAIFGQQRIRIGFSALFHSILGGAVFGLGFGVQQRVSYTPPCPLHSYCLVYNPWQSLQVGLPAGIIVGLILGLLVWLAYSLNFIIPSLPRRPHATASA